MIQIKFVVAVLTLIIGFYSTRKEIKALYDCIREEPLFIDVTEISL